MKDPARLTHLVAVAIKGSNHTINMSEPEVTGSGAEDDGEYDEMMSSPAKVHGRQFLLVVGSQLGCCK